MIYVTVVDGYETAAGRKIPISRMIAINPRYIIEYEAREGNKSRIVMMGGTNDGVNERRNVHFLFVEESMKELDSLLS